MYISKETIQIEVYVAIFIVGFIIGHMVANKINDINREH